LPSKHIAREQIATSKSLNGTLSLRPVATAGGPAKHGGCDALRGASRRNSLPAHPFRHQK
jgi:hypothetical protein